MSESNENKNANVEQEAPEVKDTTETTDENYSLKRNSDENKKPSPKKRAKTEERKEPLDLAVTFGLKDGDRLEVEWEIEHDDGEMEVHWWGATLLKHDGRTEDSVAIRQLLYDAYKTFEPSKEDVIFIGPDELASPDSENQMKFRREGQEEEVSFYTEGDLEHTLNGILMTAMTKNKASWSSMPPAKQALIAEEIAIKKERLISALKNHEGVITSETIKRLMQTAFA